jgi:uncharacterized phage protein gp47/JayE
MPLFGRTQQDLVADSISELSGNTNLTRFSAGGKARALLDSINKRVSEEYDIFDINLARAYVSSAGGQFLELIGQLLGVNKEQAYPASTSVDMEVLKFYVNSGTFGDINGGADFVINTDEVISTDPNGAGIIYRLTSDVVCDSSASVVYAGAQASIPGEASNAGANSLVHHLFTGYSDYLNNSLKVTNLYPIANGKNFETDANYRYRIVNRVLEAEAANETAIRLAALSTPGVADVIMTPRYRGIGTTGIIIHSVTPTVSDKLIEDVTARIYSAQAFGDIIYVRGPKESGLTIRTSVHYSKQLGNEELDEIESQLGDAIVNYVNNLDIGEVFIVNKLVNDLFSVSEYIANLGEPGTPLEEVYLYKISRVEDSRIRQKLLGDYTPAADERVIIETSVLEPIVFDRKYIRR